MGKNKPTIKLHRSKSGTPSSPRGRRVALFLNLPRKSRGRFRASMNMHAGARLFWVCSAFLWRFLRKAAGWGVRGFCGWGPNLPKFRTSPRQTGPRLSRWGASKYPRNTPQEPPTHVERARAACAFSAYFCKNRSEKGVRGHRNFAKSRRGFV